MQHQRGITRTVGALANSKFPSPGWFKSLLVQGSEDLSPVLEYNLCQAVLAL